MSQDLIHTLIIVMRIPLSEGIMSIEERVFNSCGSLTNIELPSSLTNIGEGAFDADYIVNITWKGLVYTDKDIFNQALIDAGVAIDNTWE